MLKLTLYTDGGSRGNPGIAGAGILITDEAGLSLVEASKPLGVMTNNEAEYQAAIFGFETLKQNFKDLSGVSIEHRLDSELVCKQLKGEYKIKEPRLRVLADQVHQTILPFKSQVVFTHIRREFNSVADKLANKAMDEQE
ncbi:MAG TPA: ribonuclease HI family protein [Candidatus Paceibacterota bacterium]|nr:ribonuclease HI family protein [Candidatus Paceibacterota bacterium]